MQDKNEYYILGPENSNLLAGSDVLDNPVDPVQLAAFVADARHEMVFATVGASVVAIASGAVLLHPDKHPAFLSMR